MNLSRRISAISPSVTIAVSAQAARMRAEGQDIVSFGAGEPDFDTPEFIKQAATEALNAGDTKYTPRSGQALRQVIAEKLAAENGLSVGAENVAVTFGGKHALYCAFQALLEPGQKVLIPSPYWVSYPNMVTLAGGEPVILPTGQDDGFQLRPEQVAEAAGEASILVLNSPCNPTGVTYSPQTLAAIAEIVLESDLLVFSDEVYEKLVYGDAEFVSFAALDSRLPERTVTFNTLSKTYAMTGWRLGWLAGPEPVAAAVRKLMSQSTTNPVSFAQAAALAAYTDPRGAETCEQMRQEFERRGRHMAERLNAIDGVRCLAPTGAFYCFPDVSAHYGRTLGGIEVTDSLSFTRAALEAVQVALVPGVAFGADAHVRLNFATSTENIDKGLDRLEKLLR
ncbi:MAG: pyridoxal phosphate-dependent aminotransferase [Phycisphaerae bacterium]|nr:pyridoxal phosphate-dependent aminotransferase [Phycisphaerae bacterium]